MPLCAILNVACSVDTRVDVLVGQSSGCSTALAVVPTAVVGILERGGKARTSVIPNRERKTLHAEVRKHADRNILGLVARLDGFSRRPHGKSASMLIGTIIGLVALLHKR